uniref:Uncharacterized protein n=1 Tax=Panagrolaimus sp. JU765 TaxID=591449 RepID=A0AC34R7G3_9BILA
ADLKHYGIQCYQLYKAQKNNPLACSTTQSRTLCCALTIGPNQNHSSLFYLAKQQAIDYLSTGYGHSKNYERMVNSTCQRAGISFNANNTYCPHAFGCFETHKTHGKRINASFYIVF